MSLVSFSLSAVARLGVPPGKWFCLARTGLGHSEYSCCVCGMHSSVFRSHWKRNSSVDCWTERLTVSLDGALRELKYGDDSALVKERILNFVAKSDNFLINSEFAKFLEQAPRRVAILTDGPLCLVTKLFPFLPRSQVFTHKSRLSEEELVQISECHVGTNMSDLVVPQTRFIVSRSSAGNFPASVRVFPKLTAETMSQITSCRTHSNVDSFG